MACFSIGGEGDGPSKWRRPRRTYESLKAELESLGVAVSDRPGNNRSIFFNDPDGHRLQLIFNR